MDFPFLMGFFYGFCQCKAWDSICLWYKYSKACLSVAGLGLGSYIVLEIILCSQVEYQQTPVVHSVFTPLIISSHLLTELNHFLEFAEDLENFRSVSVLIGQVCHKIRSSGVKYNKKAMGLMAQLSVQLSSM